MSNKTAGPSAASTKRGPTAPGKESGTMTADSGNGIISLETADLISLAHMRIITSLARLEKLKAAKRRPVNFSREINIRNATIAEQRSDLAKLCIRAQTEMDTVVGDGE